MIVVVSPERKYENEIYWVNKLFDNGLDRYHVRKPYDTFKDTMKLYAAIEPAFCSRLVFHVTSRDCIVATGQHLHVNTALRTAIASDGIQQPTSIVSTSTHSMVEFNSLSVGYKSAFLSPFYDSISKPNYKASFSLMEQLTERTNYQTQLIALGGIQEHNIATVYPLVDGVALLGAIWESTNPLASLERCQRTIDQLSV